MAILASEAHFCPGVIASAGMKNKKSYFKGARTLTSYMHELGHNINIAHSGVEGYPGSAYLTDYGDK